MPHLNDCRGDIKKQWYVEYSIRNPKTGKMERVKIYDKINKFSTYDERFDYAKKIIKDYSKQIKNGTISFQEFIEYEDMLLYDGQGSFSRKRLTKAGGIKKYLSDFLKKKKLEVVDKSYRSYQSKLRIFCSFAESKKMIDKPVTVFTNEVIADFLSELVINKSLSKKTIRAYEQILHTFFDYLKKKKIIAENPVYDMPCIGLIKDEAPAAIPSYMRRLLQITIEKEDPQLWMFICFMYYMAIRPGQELRLMRLNQIDYDSRRIIVPNYFAKNRETESIDIPDQLFEMIIEKWELYTFNQGFYVFGKYHEPGDECQTISSMRLRFNKFRDRLNLPKSVKLYSWKHSGAQELASEGVSVYEIQRHLRHRDITTTEMYLKKRVGQRSSTIKHKFPGI